MQKVLNPQENYKGYQTKMLLEISISQSDCGDMTLFQTIQEVIGRINIGKWIDFHRQRRDAYDPIALLTILLFAYARYGYASLRQLEEMSRYDLRCRWLLQGQTPSYKAYQRFINNQLKGGSGMQGTYDGRNQSSGLSVHPGSKSAGGCDPDDRWNEV